MVVWYDMQAVAGPLYQLFHLSRGAEDEFLSIVRLARAAEELGLDTARLIALRDAPVTHPALEDEQLSLERIVRGEV